MSSRVQLSPKIPPSTLEDPPLLPHTYDDEFDSDILDPSWSQLAPETFDNVTAIDPYAAIASGSRWSLNSWRKSWLMIQPANNLAIFQKMVSLPSECFAWCRCSFSLRHAGQTNNDSRVVLALSDSDNSFNSIQHYLSDTDTNVARVTATKSAAGVFTTIGSTNNIGGVNNSKAQDFCFAGIQKLNTTYHYWTANPSGSWVWMGSTTLAATLDRVFLMTHNVATGTPGNSIMGFDFFRFKLGRYLP